MSDLYNASNAIRSALSYPDPQEVVVVRPKFGWGDAVGQMLGSVIALFMRAAVVSFAAARVEFVPDFGYVESVWICMLAMWLFHDSDSGYMKWTKGWSARRAAFRDLLKKKEA